MAATQAISVNPGEFKASVRAKTLYSVCMFLGALSLTLGFMRSAEREWHAFLTAAFFFLNLGLGGLFFAAFNNVASAGWSVTVRRTAEAFTAYLPVAFISFLVLILGAKHLFIWLDPNVAHNDPLIAAKGAYLNLPFFIIRIVVFFGLWLFFKKLIVGNSLKQDVTGEGILTTKNVRNSVAFILVFAISYSLFSVDQMMSLEPHFFSTIWGVYNFAGLLQSFFAAAILFLLYIQRKGIVRGLITEEHIHDMGKFMLAFTVFYAYIAFSQFMLIWYANLPEETFYYMDRTMGGWMAATASLFIMKFAVPFLLLLPRWAKRTPSHLIMVSVLILIMQYVDIHWMVYPNLDKEHWLLGWQEIGTFLGFMGLFIWAVMRFLSRHPVVPLKDPYLDEALHHHVIY